MRVMRGAAARIRHVPVDIMVLALIWLVMVLAANPSGDFPLNDDWDYARSAQTLVGTGRFEISPIARVTLIAQALWGALFCLPFGCSFVALRWSTIVAAYIGIVALRQLLLEVGAGRKLAFVGALTLAVNPVFFELSLTFMTDVPFLASALCAVAALARALRTGTWRAVLAGAIAGAVAILVRQVALVIPLAFAPSFLLAKGTSSGKVGRAATPAILGGIALIGWQYWASSTQHPGLNNLQVQELTEALGKGPAGLTLSVAANSGVAAVYLGLFSAPFLAATGAFSGPTLAFLRWRRTALFVVAVTSIVGLLAANNALMPLAGNILFDTGLGPLTLRDTFLLAQPDWPQAPKVAWLFVTWFAVAAILLEAAAVARIIRCAGDRSSDRTLRATVVFVCASSVLYFAPITIGGYFDRYLLPLLPMLLVILSAGSVLAGRSVTNKSITFAAIAMALYAIFAIAGTHDYLAWNRARWQALDELGATILPEQIDGGFEFNGRYLFDAAYRQRAGKSWWWVQDDEYQISFGPIPGYREIRKYSFQRWLPPETGWILVLQRS